jgi:DedD protein
VTAAPPVVKASESPTDSKIVQKPDVKASGASAGKAAHVDAAPPKPDAKSDSKAPSKAAAVEPLSKMNDKNQAKAAGHPETKNEARVSPSAAVAAPKPAPAASAVDASAGWVVQLGSFASKENAEKLARELKAKKFKAFVSEFRGGGKTLWRVRVGPEQDRARIDRIAERLQGEGHKGNVAPVQ